MIVFLGLAGSGKSTQGQLLAAYLHCPWVSTGNLLREFNMDSNVQEQMLKGEIIDDETTLGVLEKELKRVGADSHECILDGSPRTLRQAQWLVEKTKAGELNLTAAIHLLTSRATAKSRLLARKRPDDTEEAISERFAEYENKVKPIIDYLKQQDAVVYDIDGNRPPEQIAADIQRLVGDKK